MNHDEQPKPSPIAKNTFGEYELALLRKLVVIPTVTRNTAHMEAYLMNELATIPGVTVTIDAGNIYATRGTVASGKFYPCVVAHTDTVHSINYNVQPFLYGDTLFAMDVSRWEQFGTGGDDKCGIFVAIMCLRLFNNIKVAFFRDEEGGCIGSNLADMKWFDDCGFVIQADRRGRYDVTKEISGMPMLSKEFMEHFEAIIKKHSRIYVSGMMTDVQALVRKGLKVCACNISCGYYEPHTSKEVINLHHLQETLMFVIDLLAEVGDAEFPFPNRYKEEKHYSTYNTYNTTTWSAQRDKYNGSSGNANRQIKLHEDSKVPYRLRVEDFCIQCGTYLNADTTVHTSSAPQTDVCENCIQTALTNNKVDEDGTYI